MNWLMPTIKERAIHFRLANSWMHLWNQAAIGWTWTIHHKRTISIVKFNKQTKWRKKIYTQFRWISRCKWYRRLKCLYRLYSTEMDCFLCWKIRQIVNSFFFGCCCADAAWIWMLHKFGRKILFDMTVNNFSWMMNNFQRLFCKEKFYWT